MNHCFLLIPLGLWCWKLWRDLQAAKAREQVLLRRLKAHPPDPRLNPHFLFNALNTIRYLIRTNAGSARELILDLSLVLQSSMRTESQVSLREDLEAGRAYLRLEQARVGERLEVEDEVPDLHLNQLVESGVLLSLLQALVKAACGRPQGGRVSLRLQETTLILAADGVVSLLEPPPKELSLREDNDKTVLEWRING